VCSEGCESQHPSHPTAAECLGSPQQSGSCSLGEGCPTASVCRACAVQAGFYLTGESVWEREQQLLHLETFICFLFLFFNYFCS